jgi:NAD(P)-dependent dehydrogenase (short-subunit alcohol dehydrogenase family)
MTADMLADQQYRQDRMERTPLGRLGTAQDVAYGVLYLASDESSFVTGSELVIDGGRTAQ